MVTKEKYSRAAFRRWLREQKAGSKPFQNSCPIGTAFGFGTLRALVVDGELAIAIDRHRKVSRRATGGRPSKLWSLLTPRIVLNVLDKVEKKEA